MSNDQTRPADRKVRSRTRITLKSLLLFTLCCSLGLTISLQMRQNSNLKERLRAREVELVELRKQTQQLEVEEFDRVHVMAVRGEVESTRAFRLYAPPGQKLLLCEKVGGLPSEGIPKVKWQSDNGLMWSASDGAANCWQLNPGESELWLDFRESGFSREFRYSARSRLSHRVRELSGVARGGLGASRYSTSGNVAAMQSAGVVEGETYVGAADKAVVVFDSRGSDSAGEPVLIWIEPAPPVKRGTGPGGLDAFWGPGAPLPDRPTVR